MSKSKLQDEVNRLEKKYGYKSASLASTQYQFPVIPSGILALDYALGTGGWPLGRVVEIYGSPDAGKSSIFGFGAIRNAQAQGKYCAIVSVEPGFDPKWAEKNGVDVDNLIVVRPNDGEDAFHLLYEFVAGDIIDFVVFDSIGAVLRPSEVGDKGKPSQGGAAALIAHGVKNILQPCWKNQKGVMLLNQVRDVMSAQVSGLLDSPGGWAVKHAADIRIHLSNDGYPYRQKFGEDEVIIGRPLKAVIKRNKLSEGSDKRARFDFYQMETSEHQIGIDQAKDVRQVAVRTGVMNKSGAWYYRDEFPTGKLQGEVKVDEFLNTNPKVIEKIRAEVLKRMIERKGEPRLEENGRQGHEEKTV